jgi:hypothetical protein
MSDATDEKLLGVVVKAAEAEAAAGGGGGGGASSPLGMVLHNPLARDTSSSGWPVSGPCRVLCNYLVICSLGS